LKIPDVAALPKKVVLPAERLAIIQIIIIKKRIRRAMTKTFFFI